MIRRIIRALRLAFGDFSKNLSVRRRVLVVIASILMGLTLGSLVGGDFSPFRITMLLLFCFGAVLFNGVIALEITEKKAYESEMALAARIQRGFLPRTLPAGENFHFAGYHTPARAVGGDYYDVVDLGGGRFGLLIADVSGKGAPAALLMASVHAQFHILANAALPPGKLLARMNTALSKTTEATEFVTVFYGIWDGVRQTLHYSNGGHEPPILVSEDGALKELDKGGTPLGAIADMAYEEGTVSIGPGEGILLYTDGITETTNRHGEFFDAHRLIEVLSANKGEDAASLVRTVVTWTTMFRGGEEQTDDVTLLALSVD